MLLVVLNLICIPKTTRTFQLSSKETVFFRNTDFFRITSNMILTFQIVFLKVRNLGLFFYFRIFLKRFILKKDQEVVKEIRVPI